MNIKYIKKPIIIEAVQVILDENNYVTLSHYPKWIKEALDDGITLFRDDLLGKFFCKTIEGVMSAPVGHWIIKGVQGELYPCSDIVFKMTYEKVEG